MSHTKVCARFVKEVLNEPSQVIPLQYLEKRRKRLRLMSELKLHRSKCRLKHLGHKICQQHIYGICKPHELVSIKKVALVNYACAMLPYIPLPPLIPPIRPLPPADPSPDDEENRHGHVDNHGHSRDQNNSQGPYRHEQGPGHGHGHEHEHGHKHGHGHNHSHGHGQEHRHRHRHRHHESPARGNCCRWLNELDDECVCDMLVRLPSFLSRPMHAYTLYLDETCNITYACEGRRLRP